MLGIGLCIIDAVVWLLDSASNAAVNTDDNDYASWIAAL